MYIDREEIISEIIRLELEITEALINGHIAHDDDQFKFHREILKRYRSLLFGNK